MPPTPFASVNRSSQPFAFAPLEVGCAEGIWQRDWLDVQVTVLAGDAKLQQTLVEDGVYSV